MPVTPPGQTRERIYRFVRERLLAGNPPTIREVQKAFDFRAVETARGHLQSLVQEGRLAKRDGARGFMLPEHDSSHASGSPSSSGPSRLIPILGNVQAGTWNTAIQELDGYVAVETVESPESLFGLRVRGESMLLAGILPGDLVIVRRQTSAHSGDIVVALVDEDATVKRLRLRHGRVELHPENPDFETLIPPRDRVQILGKVIEVRRYLLSGSSSPRRSHSKNPNTTSGALRPA